MAKERKAYAPFSLTSEAGVAQTPVEGYIDVRQEIYPTVSTGTINENGKWTGVKSDDTDFIGLSKDLQVGDGTEIFAPSTNNVPSIDMTGFTSLFIAVKPSRTGDYAIQACMGPDTIRFANLEPVNAGAQLKGNADRTNIATLAGALIDGTEALTADVWNIFFILDKLAGQKNMQFKIINNSGGASDIEFGFLRLV
jgi:hypothetical protein